MRKDRTILGLHVSVGVVVWRSGAVLGIVIASSLDGDGDARARAAVRLAALQQERIANPTPLRPPVNDDRFVLLDDPTLKATVMWLGEQLPARGGFPALDLRATDQTIGLFTAPQLLIRLIYGTPRLPHTMKVALWQSPSCTACSVGEYPPTCASAASTRTLPRARLDRRDPSAGAPARERSLPAQRRGPHGDRLLQRRRGHDRREQLLPLPLDPSIRALGCAPCCARCARVHCRLHEPSTRRAILVAILAAIAQAVAPAAPLSPEQLHCDCPTSDWGTA